MKQTIKKIISSVIVNLMILLCFSFSVEFENILTENNLNTFFIQTANAAISGNYTYVVNNEKATITGFFTEMSGEVELPASIGGYPVVAIGESAFSYCHNVTKIVIPDTVISIGNGAFLYCIKLGNVVIPNSVKSIGNSAFGGCYSLVEINIPKSITTIGNHAFECVINVDDDNQSYSSDNGVLFNKNKTQILSYPRSGARIYEIPSSVTHIGDSAFADCKIENLLIPNSVVFIGNRAFANCTSLKSIEIPDSVIGIGEGAFWACSELTSITIPDSVTSIGAGAFHSCWGLKGIIIPESVTKINKMTFYCCYGLKNVIIPSSVTDVEEKAFGECSILENVYYVGSKQAWQDVDVDKSNADFLRANIQFDYCLESADSKHKYDEKITRPATHLTNGEKKFICSKCDYFYCEDVAPDLNNHTNTKNVAEVKATCTTKGYTAGKYCNDCKKYISGHTETVINPSNHANTKTVPATPATFDAIGYTAGVYCNDCKKYISGHTEIPKLVPEFTDSNNAKESGNNIVSNNGLTVAQLLSQAGKGAVITTKDGKAVTDKDLIGTGMILTMSNGSKKEIVVYGDGDGDGKITSADARYALRASVGLEKTNEASCYYKAANVDGDKLSSSDARAILRASVGLEDSKKWMK